MSTWPKETLWTKHGRLFKSDSRIEILPLASFLSPCSVSKLHRVLSSLKKREMELRQELDLQERSDYLSDLSRPNKYLLSNDTQCTLKLMLHTALEISVISVNVSIAPWPWMALLSLRESCHFPDYAQLESRPDDTPRAGGRAAKQGKAQGREDKLIKFMFSEVCGCATVFGESNLMAISNKEKDLHLRGTSVFTDY